MGNSKQPIAAWSGGLRPLLALTVVMLCVTSCSAGASASPSSVGPRATPAAATATASPAVEPPSLPSGFRAVSGMNGWGAFKLSGAQRDQQLATMEAEGVKVVRSDAPWAYIEPAPPGQRGGVYQLWPFDSWVSALASHHLTWQPLIDYSVWWAKTCSGFCAPAADSTYAVFAQTIAARYGPNGSFWAQNPRLPYYPAQTFEIWNEEDSATYWVAPSRFATLYSAARAAIHAVDPTASVIVGGLAEAPQPYDPNQDYPARYVAAMLSADPGLRGNVDGFGLHPYGANAVDTLRWTVHFREVLDALGEAGAPIDVTEFGWPTGDGSHEAWRASMMSAVGAELARSDCGVRLLEPYDWVNPRTDSSGDFGLVDSTALVTALRPAGTSWFKALDQANTMPELRLCDPPPAQPNPRTHHKHERHRRPAKRRRG